jgi:hypothetical protein
MKQENERKVGWGRRRKSVGGAGFGAALVVGTDYVTEANQLVEISAFSSLLHREGSDDAGLRRHELQHQSFDL